jgi:hypothetical protein
MDKLVWVKKDIIAGIEEVYCHITGGKLSYYNYPAKTIIAEFEELHYNKDIIKSDIADLIKDSEYVTKEQLIYNIRDYFNI